ncbi:hypothetical protein V3C41_00240 [Paenarthrobacter nicotinovorans]|uniref:Uncharacterized protein n=1 Tax=Paenarthrobacter nicotinovorans TaxID=29320 RepID=A0ABV0GLX7_PAENI
MAVAHAFVLHGDVGRKGRSSSSHERSMQVVDVHDVKHGKDMFTDLGEV